MTARFIDIHILHTVPFSNLNRDDLGSPKVVVYGGATRGRISSQCWKRATREHMQDNLADVPGYDTTLRTRRAVPHLALSLQALGWDEADALTASRVAFAAFMKEAKVDAGSEVAEVVDVSAVASKRGPEASGDIGNVLLFLTQSQYDEIADLISANREQVLTAGAAKASKTAKAAYDKGTGKLVEKVIADPRGLVSVFGRMLASLPSGNVESGVQVAHALTTHETATEFDYFSAVDDLNTHEDTGAGHIGTGEFTSGVYYRYATVDLDDLTANTGSVDDAGLLTTQFLHSFVKSLPSGKSNATAPHTLPGLVVLTVRDDKPVSYASAYEKPVRANGEGHMIPSVECIAEHATLVAKVYGNTPAWSGHVNAATTNPTTVAALAAAFGEEPDTGLDGLIAAAVKHAGLSLPPEFTAKTDKTTRTHEPDKSAA